MSDDRVFYEVAPGTPEFEWCQKYQQAREAKSDAYQAYAKSLGAKGWTLSFGAWLGGFVFEYDKCDVPGLRKKGRTSDGYDHYIPRARGDEGKAISAAMNALGRMPDADDFCKEFGVPQSMTYSKPDATSRGATRFGFLETAQVGWTTPDKFWIVLPDIAQAIADRQADGYTTEPVEFVVPRGIKRSTKARYELASAAAKVAAEEATCEE